MLASAANFALVLEATNDTVKQGQRPISLEDTLWG
jgi:hypothetical protein